MMQQRSDKALQEESEKAAADTSPAAERRRRGVAEIAAHAARGGKRGFGGGMIFALGAAFGRSPPEVAAAANPALNPLGSAALTAKAIATRAQLPPPPHIHVGSKRSALYHLAHAGVHAMTPVAIREAFITTGSALAADGSQHHRVHTHKTTVLAGHCARYKTQCRASMRCVCVLSGVPPLTSFPHPPLSHHSPVRV